MIVTVVFLALFFGPFGAMAQDTPNRTSEARAVILATLAPAERVFGALQFDTMVPPRELLMRLELGFLMSANTDVEIGRVIDRYKSFLSPRTFQSLQSELDRFDSANRELGGRYFSVQVTPPLTVVKSFEESVRKHLARIREESQPE